MKIWGRKINDTSERLLLFTVAEKMLKGRHETVFAVNVPMVNGIDGLTGLPVFVLATVGPKINIKSVYNFLKNTHQQL